MSGLVSHAGFLVVTWIAAIFGGIGIAAAFLSAIIGYRLTEDALLEANTKISEARIEADAKIEVAREEAKVAVEKAQADAAAANARALEAQLALEKFKQPRVFSDEQRDRLRSKLEAFGKTRFDAAVIPGDPEALIFVSHITATLEWAKWVWVEWVPPGAPLQTTYTIAGKPNMGHFGSFGVIVLLNPDHASALSKAAEALVEAIRFEGFEAALEIVANPSIPNKDTVHVTVGKKR
jgi:hypothetical protein